MALKETQVPSPRSSPFPASTPGRTSLGQTRERNQLAVSAQARPFTPLQSTHLGERAKKTIPFEVAAQPFRNFPPRDSLYLGNLRSTFGISFRSLCLKQRQGSPCSSVTSRCRAATGLCCCKFPVSPPGQTADSRGFLLLFHDFPTNKNFPNKKCYLLIC